MRNSELFNRVYYFYNDVPSSTLLQQNLLKRSVGGTYLYRRSLTVVVSCNFIVECLIIYFLAAFGSIFFSPYSVDHYFNIVFRSRFFWSSLQKS